MAKESYLRLMVSVGIGLVIAPAVFSAFVVIPMMEMHPEVIEDGAADSAWFMSVIIPLIIAAFLLASFIPNRHNLVRIRWILILGVALIIIGSLAIAKEANYYSEYDFAIPELICAGAYLIAGILLIIVSVKIKRSTSSEKK